MVHDPGRLVETPTPMECSDACDELLTSRQLGARLGVSKRTVNTWTRRGVIPGLHHSGGVLYLFADVERALGEHGWRGNQKARRRAEATCDSRSCSRCERTFARDHYPPSAGVSGGWWCRDCRTPLKRAHDIRRRRATGAAIEPIALGVVAVRDGWRCAICRGEVTRANWSLDHVVPISKGGPHTYENVVLAHRSCNSRRGAGRFPVQGPLIAKPWTAP